jgi:hypothetical protein
MSTVALTNAASNPEVKHLLAERFRSKLCRNYVMYGQCPYENRCMFAHGEHELRTMEQNVKDGLITEEAIKSYQRVMRYRSRSQPQGDAPAYVSTETLSAATATRYAHNPYSVTNVYTYLYDSVASESEGETSEEDCSPVTQSFKANPAVLEP